MKIIRHPQKGKLHRPVVALGTFDGVHLGHRQVLRAAVKQAKKLGAHSAAITFHPHPQEVIVPQRGLKLLTTLKEREELFCRSGIDSVIVIKFTRHLQKLSCAKFVANYLVKKLGVRWVCIGYDYAFGKGRSAGTGRLQELGKKFDFGVTVVPPLKVGGQIAKSGKIREMLGQGMFNRAVKMLGHPYRLTGRVVRGAGRGKELGFPTANLKLDPDKLIPAQGVYYGLVDNKKCVVNIGARPTFGVGELLVEVHLLNFHGDLRGRTLSVELLRRLRAEKQFTDALALREQIRKDVVRVQRV